MGSEARRSIRFAFDYRDAGGNDHLRFTVTEASGKEYKGEAVYDTKFARTILNDDVLRLPRDIVVEIKRGAAEFAKAGMFEPPRHEDTKEHKD